MNNASKLYRLLNDCPDYKRAVSKLQQLYDKPKNEIHVGYILLMCHQKPKEILGKYLLKLRHLSEDCNYKAVSAEEHKTKAIRDTLISGQLSINIR